MYKQVAIAGMTAAAILGVGTAALAASGTTGGSPTPAAASSTVSAKHAGHGGHGGHAKFDRRALHGQFVTHGKNKTFVTHDVIRGQVTSVSGNTIVVTAADKTSETFVANSATTVRVRTAGKGAKGTVSQVANGDHVLVVGTGTGSGPYTATHIVDVKK